MLLNWVVYIVPYFVNLPSTTPGSFSHSKLFQYKKLIIKPNDATKI